MIGIIDNIEKDFHIDTVFNRDENTIKRFISMYVDSGNNNAVSDGLAYNYIDNQLSGFHHYRANGSCDFWIGVQSKSQIIWEQIKSKIKENYDILFYLKSLCILLEKLSLK